MAGATAAFALARAGLGVTLIDQAPVQPPVFKAEKIEPDQADILRALGLMELVRPECRRIHRIACGQRGRVWRIIEIEQYGCFYQDMANAVRRNLAGSAQVRIGRVVQVRTSVDVQEVTLADGTVLKGRLLVLATGVTGKLHEQLGIKRRAWSPAHSLCIGFNLRPVAGLPAQSESVSYRETDLESGIDYISLFPIKDVFRANLFVYWPVEDPRVHAMRSDGLQTLLDWMPGLTRITGSLVLTSKVEARPIDLYRVENAVQPGVALIGDVYQSVCPATGTGLSKVLVDVQTLSELAPAWLKTPGMAADKIGQLYRNERKSTNDERSLTDALYRRRLCMDRTLGWRVRRWKKYFGRRLMGWRMQFHGAMTIPRSPARSP